MTAVPAHMVIDWWEIVLRLGTATLAGAAIGLNRDLHGKPIGLRTLAIVSLASAMVVTIVDLSDATLHVSDATSRVIQGILTGIGFLGAGVIMRSEAHTRVRGLTNRRRSARTGCGCGDPRIGSVRSSGRKLDDHDGVFPRLCHSCERAPFSIPWRAWRDAIATNISSPRSVRPTICDATTAITAPLMASRR